jgi:hypothetical protein
VGKTAQLKIVPITTVRVTFVLFFISCKLFQNRYHFSQNFSKLFFCSSKLIPIRFWLAGVWSSVNVKGMGCWFSKNQFSKNNLIFEQNYFYFLYSKRPEISENCLILNKKKVLRPKHEYSKKLVESSNKKKFFVKKVLF